MALGETNYTRDNLVTSTVKLVTGDTYQLESGQSVVRGEILKRGATGLVAMALGADEPFTIALENIDATAGAKNISYMVQGSALESELTITGAGVIADYRDGLRDAGIVTEA
jgi:hypothetical protein